MRMDFELLEDQQEMFMKAIRYMLAHTYILKAKEEELYSFVSDESNLQKVNDYLAMIGFQVNVQYSRGVAVMRTSAESLPRTMLCEERFRNYEMQLLIIFWIAYQEKTATAQPTILKYRELTDLINSRGIEVARDKRKLNMTLKKFKDYDLIDYKEKDLSEETIITMYPSLQMGLDEGQFDVVAREQEQLLAGIEPENENDDTVDAENIENTEEEGE